MKKLIITSGVFAVLIIGFVVWWIVTTNESVRIQARPTVMILALSRSFLTDSQRIVPSQSANLSALYQAPGSDQIRYLLGTLGDRSYSTRSAALRLFGPYLNKADITALEDFLTDPHSLDRLSLQEAAALKNDVMNLLRNQLHPPDDLAATFIKMFESDQQPEVMRDYAIQHLGSWYVDGASAEEQTQIWPVLEQGAMGHTGSIPGTSLLAMLRLDNLNPQQKSALQQAALQQIQYAGTDGLTLATSLQVCSQLQLHQAYPVALHLAGSDQTSLPVRASAIAAVGDLGTASDVTQLENWMNGDQPRLRLPASAALQRLRKRLNL